MRVVIVKNIVVPNTGPLFEVLAARNDCQVHVVYETATEANRRWPVRQEFSYGAEVLSSRTIRLPRLAPESFVHLPRRPLQAISDFAPDVVVASGGVWSSPTNIAAAVAKRRYGWAFVPWWGEFRSPWRSRASRVTEPWKRLFVAAGDAWLAYSDRAAADARRLGADPVRTVLVPNTPRDPELPLKVASRPHDPRTRRLLFIGQLIKRKGLLTLLEAFDGLPSAELWIAGDGPLKDLVQARANRDARVRYLGHLDWNGLQEAYHQADVHVLPSLYEVWGLVVNEAAAHGLPSVVSDQVGAADHLVSPGRTGQVFTAGDVHSLRAALMRQLAWGPDEHRACAETARAGVSEWTVQRAADALVAGCYAAVDASGASVGPG